MGKLGIDIHSHINGLIHRIKNLIEGGSEHLPDSRTHFGFTAPAYSEQSRPLGFISPLVQDHKLLAAALVNCTRPAHYHYCAKAIQHGVAEVSLLNLH